MEKIKFNISDENLQEELDAMFNSFKAYAPAVREAMKMGINDEVAKKYIVKINDWVEDLKYCSNCPGINNCKKNNPYLCTKITYRNGAIERNLVQCPRMLELFAIEEQFDIKDFDGEYENASIKNIDKLKGRKAILDQYKMFLKEQDNSWIFITGSPRTGRSYLACAIANDFASRKKGKIDFINTSFRFKELNDLSYNNKSEFEHMINSMKECALLVMDDFGNEYKNDFIRDGVLSQILNARANKRLMTIFTSDYNIDEIVELYSTTKAAAIRAKQIGRTVKANSKEFSLGDLGAY